MKRDEYVSYGVSLAIVAGVGTLASKVPGVKEHFQGVGLGGALLFMAAVMNLAIAVQWLLLEGFSDVPVLIMVVAVLMIACMHHPFVFMAIAAVLGVIARWK